MQPSEPTGQKLLRPSVYLLIWYVDWSNNRRPLLKLNRKFKQFELP